VYRLKNLHSRDSPLFSIQYFLPKRTGESCSLRAALGKQLSASNPGALSG